MKYLSLTIDFPALDPQSPLTIIKIDPTDLHTFASTQLASTLSHAATKMFCFALPPGATLYGETVFCLGKVSKQLIRDAALQAGLSVEETYEKSIEDIRDIDEGLLMAVGEAYVKKHLCAAGFSPVMDGDFYISGRDFFGANGFVEGAKVVVHIDNSRTQYTSKPAKLALTLSIEPAVYRAIRLDFQQMQSQLQELAENGLDPLSFDDGCVNCLPRLESVGHVIGLYETFPATPLVKANREKGYARYIPTNEIELRRWWQHSYNVSLPEGPLKFARITFPFANHSFVYPTCALVRFWSHIFSKSSLSYDKIMKAFIDIFRTLPQQSTPLSVLQHPTYMQAPETNKIGQSTTEGTKPLAWQVAFQTANKLKGEKKGAAPLPLPAISPIRPEKPPSYPTISPLSNKISQKENLLNAPAKNKSSQKAVKQNKVALPKAEAGKREDKKTSKKAPEKLTEIFDEVGEGEPLPSKKPKAAAGTKRAVAPKSQGSRKKKA